VPYSICLVDLAEGVRAMAHTTADSRIGMPAMARYIPFGSVVVPLFEPDP
jgi:hypothetical protein